MLDVLRSVTEGQALWAGRKAVIRLTAIAISEVYDKSLRCSVAVLHTVAFHETGEMSGTESGVIADARRVLGIQHGNNDDATGGSGGSSGRSNGQGGSKTDKQASIGRIINHLSIDCFRVAAPAAYNHILWAVIPTQLIMSVILLWTIIGYSSIPGLVIMFTMFPLYYLYALGFSKASRNTVKATDKRIGATNEVLQNIRAIKLFAWELRFMTIVNKLRSGELRARLLRLILCSGVPTFGYLIPILSTFFSFFVYTVIKRKPLYPSVAFTTISMFMLLRVPLGQLSDRLPQLQETQVSLDRVEKFLLGDETGKYEQLGTDTDRDGNMDIGFGNATFVWGDKEYGTIPFQLENLDVRFEIGMLNLIAGAAASLTA